jgi:hypothetical protein
MTADYRTPPRAERPRAVNLVGLRKMRIGPIWPSDPDREIGMRGTIAPSGTEPHWMAYREYRRARRRASRATRRANR